MRFPLLVSALLLALVAVACSSDEGGDTIPSSEDVVAPPTTEAGPETTLGAVDLDPEEVSRRFSECMRDEGIDFPDLRIDAQGRPVIGDALDSVDTTSPEFQRALSTCSGILAETGALDLSSDPELQAAIIDQLAGFSECMRVEGVVDFPDPNPGYTGTGSPFPLDEIPLDDPAFTSAIDTCGADLASVGLGE